MTSDDYVYRNAYNATLRNLIRRETNRSKIQRAQLKAEQAAARAVEKYRSFSK